jgi:hypothetical protein
VAARKQKQKQRRMSAQVVEDEDYQLRYEIVAGIDVAKESAVVCVRMPPAEGRKHRMSHLQTVPATVPVIGELAAELKAAGVQMVSMEATSDYWRIWLRREAPCCIPGLAGRNLEDIPGSDGLLKIRKVKGTIACQETSGRADAYGRRAGKTRVIWLKLYCLNPNLQKG